MKAARGPLCTPAHQIGLTYLEVIVAMVLIALALVPAMQALQTGMLGSETYRTSTEQYYIATSRMEEVLAEQHGSLVMAASTAGGYAVPSNYSDPPGSPLRRLVYLSLYDAEDADGDGDYFTVADPDSDGDGDPYTGYMGLVWIKVEIEGTLMHFESLVVL